MTRHNFEPHKNSDTFPIFPQNDTQPIIEQIYSTHKEQIRVWQHQQAIIKCRKNLLTNGFEDKCYEWINDLCVGFNSDSIQDMLTYLYDSFGKVSPLELEDTEKYFTQR